MKLLNNILLATDFSKSSKNVVDNAIVLAKTFQSKITLVHILHDDIRNEKARNLLDEVAGNQLNSINDRINKEGVLTDKPILEYGNYSDNIVSLAERLNFNIIVIGSGEKITNTLSELGKTATNIIRKSDKPVFVVKENKVLKIAQILCPVDFSNESTRALKNAITFARNFKAKLLVLNVYKMEYPSAFASKMEWDEENNRKNTANTKKLDLFLKDFNLIDLDWAREIQGGDLAFEIRKAVRKHKSDILIMGTTRRSGISRMLRGSITEEVVKQVPCSFITQKDKEILSLEIESKIRDIESHYQIAKQLTGSGFFEEAIKEYNICLNINFMHIPSLKGISQVYKTLGELDKSEVYKVMIKEIMENIWNEKIEEEVRKNRSK